MEKKIVVDIETPFGYSLTYYEKYGRFFELTTRMYKGVPNYSICRISKARFEKIVAENPDKIRA